LDLLGFEPRTPLSESGVFPLNYRPKDLFYQVLVCGSRKLLKLVKIIMSKIQWRLKNIGEKENLKRLQSQKEK
jgi:hypothetical protein